MVAKSNNPAIHEHSSELQYYDKSVAELVHDPRNYMFVNGVKMISLQCVMQMKQRRNEPKDVADVEKIKLLGVGGNK